MPATAGHLSAFFMSIRNIINDRIISKSNQIVPWILRRLFFEWFIWETIFDRIE